MSKYNIGDKIVSRGDDGWFDDCPSLGLTGEIVFVDTDGTCLVNFGEAAEGWGRDGGFYTDEFKGQNTHWWLTEAQMEAA